MSTREIEIAYWTAGNAADLSRIREQNEREWFATVLELPVERLVVIQGQLEAQRIKIDDRFRFVSSILCNVRDEAA